MHDPAAFDWRPLAVNCVLSLHTILLFLHSFDPSDGDAVSLVLIGLENQQRLSASLIVEPELHRSVMLTHTIRRPNTRAAQVVQQWFEKQAPQILKGMIVNR